MKNTRTVRVRKTILLIVATGIALTAVTFPIATATASNSPAAAARVPEPTPTSDEQAIIDWAFALYADAGLELPDIEIGFYRTKDACEGSKGTYRPQPDGPAIARVCDWHEKPAMRSAWRRRTLIHELGHAWADHNLNEHQEAEYVEHRGATHWNDRTQPWETRAAEHAAEILTWGIIDQRMRVDFRIEFETSCDELADSYRLLTGLEAVNGLAHNC
jgi:hypothetical protein